METSQMFEQASRLKLRFESARGALTVEDLWDLPLQTGSAVRPSLDAIAIHLDQRLKQSTDVVSFVSPAADTGNDMLRLSFEIVKHIISVRVRERDELKAAADRREKKQRLMELIARKEDEALSQKSVDELQRMVESL